MMFLKVQKTTFIESEGRPVLVDPESLLLLLLSESFFVHFFINENAKDSRK